MAVYDKTKTVKRKLFYQSGSDKMGLFLKKTYKTIACQTGFLKSVLILALLLGAALVYQRMGKQENSPSSPITPPSVFPQTAAISFPQKNNVSNVSDELLQLEWKIVEETNLARLYPQEYASKLLHLRGYVQGNRIKIPHIDEISLSMVSEFNDVLLQGLPEQLRFYYQNSINQLYQHAQQNPHTHLIINLPGIELKEGLAVVDEAIEFLQRQSPLPPLIYSIGLSRAAQDHVLDQGAQGFVGHIGNDGSHISDRINRYGTWRKSSGENIAYGYATAESNLIGLIIDDDVPDRGHRINIFNPNFNYIGVACGYHSYYQIMCVMNYAGEYYE